MAVNLSPAGPVLHEILRETQPVARRGPLRQRTVKIATKMKRSLWSEALFL
jgi:hypothetical protein